jgi:hypothetical protein
MLHRYRIMGAILALREFTAAQLAHYSGVKETTVRTVLNRESRFVERIGVEGRGRRGGQPIRYQMRADAEQELVRMLRDLEEVSAPPRHGSDEETDLALLSLVAAEDILLRRLPQAVPAERSHLLTLASTDFETAQSAAPHGQRGIATHLTVVDLLLRLAEVEQDALLQHSSSVSGFSPPQEMSSVAPSHEAEKKLAAINCDLRRILSGRPVRADTNLMSDLVYRVGSSPFARALLQPQDRDTGQVIGISTQVLVCEVAATAGTSRLLAALTDQQMSAFDLSVAEWDTIAERVHGPVSVNPVDPTPLTAFCVSTVAGGESWQAMLRPFGFSYGALRRAVVVTDRYDAAVSNYVNQLQGRYLPAQDMDPASLVGAVCGALSEPAGLLTRAIATEATALLKQRSAV